jgi:hypothetical protein
MLAASLLPRVFDLVGNLVVAGQHHARLDFDQRAGHFEEVADGVDVDFLENGQVFKKLLRDRRERDFGHVKLELAHEVQQ